MLLVAPGCLYFGSQLETPTLQRFQVGGIPGTVILSLLSLAQSFHPLIRAFFSSVAQSCPTLCDPVEHSIPGFSVSGSGGGWLAEGKSACMRMPILNRVSAT